MTLDMVSIFQFLHVQFGGFDFRLELHRGFRPFRRRFFVFLFALSRPAFQDDLTFLLRLFVRVIPFSPQFGQIGRNGFLFV